VHQLTFQAYLKQQRYSEEHKANAMLLQYVALSDNKMLPVAIQENLIKLRMLYHV
jgi:hypothetical protein